jgi:glycine cleavage system H lipoate-binding protein
MTCPFLKEAQVRYCRCSTVRKLIPLSPAGHSDEKCSSESHASCPVYQSQPEEETAFGPCPYLRESLMQYCGAASVAKFVPYSESLLSRCGNDGYRYCELYLAMAHPGMPTEDVDGIPLPGWLQYSANHMWLDVTDDGSCHAGIDGFLSRALGTIDRITYVWLAGQHRPTAVITVAGTDLEVVFPNSFLLTKCNLYLRADPSKITTEPYTGGWLFEGVPAPETTDNLVRGSEARHWMEEEQRHMNEFLQQSGSHSQELGPSYCDGGLFASGVARHLDRDRLLALSHEFFSPYASRKGKSK